MALIFDNSKESKYFSYFFVLVFGIFYFLIPFFLKDIYPPEICTQVSVLTFFAVIFFYFGLHIRDNTKLSIKKIIVDFDFFSTLVFGFFITVVAVTIVTSKSVPIIDAISGKDQFELIIAREEFLKTREGWESFLAYITSTIDTTFLPYVIVYSFLIKSKKRFIFLGIFFLYSISFLEKAYFFKLAVPLFIFFLYQSQNKFRFLLKGSIYFLIFVFFMYFLTKTDNSHIYRDDPYFSILHIPNGILASIFWRATGVPVATVIDAITIFNERYHSYFWGATSSFIASIFGMERINFERIVYFAQFGGSGTGNANQCYIVEAFVNFGYVGVILFSFLIGRLVNLAVKTREIAIICIIPLFIYNLFNSGFIGNMLSNGFFLFFLFIKFFKVKNNA